MFKRAILEHVEVIEKALGENKSYDGYISLTSSSVGDELKYLKCSNYEPDSLVLKTLLEILVPTEEFFIYDWLVYNDDNEELEE